MVGGSSNSDISGNKTTSEYGSGDYWVVGFNNNGNKVMELVIGGTETDRPHQLTKLNNSNLVIIGTSSSGISGNKTETNRGDSDVWLIELDLALDIKKIRQNSSLNAYPIPTNTYLNFSIPVKGSQSQIILTDITGKVVYSAINEIGHDEKIDISNLPTGLYILSVESSSFHYARTVVIE